MPVAHVTEKRGRADGVDWRLRLAALVALMAPVAMAVVAAVALVGNVAIAALAVALTVAVTAAIWVALTRRGAWRILGATLSLLGTAGLVVVLATHWQGVVVLVILLSLIALFGVAARYVLGRTGEAQPEGSRSTSRAAPRAGTAALIINLKSGGGKAERFELASEARRRGVQPIVLHPGDDLLQLAETAMDNGAEVIGMAGGDGSQALVATVAARRGIPHVCIPAGTRNHFALDLGLDRDDVVGALDAFTDGVERRIDLARVNDRVFVNNASLGVYAKVVQSDAYRDAKLQTWTEMLPSMLGPGAEPIDLEFTTPDGSTCSDAPLVLVSNNRYQLAHLAGAGTRARIDEGVLGIAVARMRSAQDVSKLVALELVGQAVRFAGLLSWSSPEFEVRSGGPVEIGLDGEALVMQPPLHFASMPGALRVRIPQGTGLAPAARAVPLTGSSLRALGRVAAGR
ncbi:MAG TPA: diacylglycerol kinase family protein [Solirubrobacteraceae bacterium]|jgi:diacylglycerol kinase family enzyme|nr:diacylglycerol kinase family protein [Solirubrobacteraceae bacterium]